MPTSPRRPLAALLFGALLAFAAPAIAQTPAGPAVLAAGARVELPFERVTLPNGLVVILAEDHRAPMVAFNLRFHVGRRHDPPGRRGITKLVNEVLEGVETRHLGAGDRAAIFAAAGTGGWEARLDHDFDASWARVTAPASALELLLWMESDRMAFAADGFDAAAVKRAREAIERGEQHQRDMPFASVFGELSRAVFGDAHPHGRAYGPSELGAVTPESARAHLGTWFVPANGVLVLSGDFVTSRARDLCARYFGKIAGGARPADQPALPAALAGERRVRIEADVGMTMVAVAWPTIAYYTDDDLLMDQIATLLEQRLVAGLVDAGAAYRVQARQWSKEGASLFTVITTLRPGRPAAEAIAAIDREIAALAAKGPASDELRGTRLYWSTRVLRYLGEPAERAEHLGQYEAGARDPFRLARVPGMHHDATPAAIRRVVTEQLGARRVIAEVVPTKGAPPGGRVASGHVAGGAP